MDVGKYARGYLVRCRYLESGKVLFWMVWKFYIRVLIREKDIIKLFGDV